MENYAEIQTEVLNYYDAMQENFTPTYGYEDKPNFGWKSLSLYVYFLKSRSVCRSFPVTDSIVSQIPGMCGASISVLEGKSKIFPHIGDTDGIIRYHLGLRVPAGLPELGFQVKSEMRAWGNGEVLSFCTVHRHKAWNNTDQNLE